MSGELSRREFLGLMGGSAAALALASCGGGEGPGTPGGRALDEWVVAAAEDPTVYTNPLMPGGGVGSFRVQNHVFDTLTMAEGSDLSLRSFLIESYDIAEPTRIRLHLRKNVTFHNGDPVTPEDIKYTIETGNADTRLVLSYYVGAVERVDVVDPQTADLVLSKPYSPLLYNFGFISGIVSKRARESGVDQFNKTPIGAGAYKVAGQWVPGQSVTVEAYDGYYQGRATPKRLTVKLVQDPSTRTAELLSGRAHIIENVSIADIPLIDKSGKAKVRANKASEGLGRIIMYTFNPSRPFFSDVRVRQALNYAVDREQIVNNILEGHGALLAGIMPNGWTGYLPDIEPWPYDPAKAKSLLQQAGYGNGFEFTWEITDGVFLRDREIAEAVAPMLADVGVKANLRITERAVQFENFYAGKWDLNTLQWPTMKDPDGNMVWNWDSSAGTAKYQPYDVLRQLSSRATATYDPNERRTIYEELNRTGWELCPWLYVHVQDEIWASSVNIPWTPYPFAGQATETWYYDRAALASKFFSG